MNRRNALLATFLYLIATSPAFASDAEDKKLITGTWKTVIGAKYIYKADGTWTNALGETGDWTVKNGRLIQYSRIFGVPVETLNESYVVTSRTLKVGKLIPWTRAD